jgi:hypothetical protein
MLFLGIIIWLVFVYAAITVISGPPLYKLLRDASPQLLKQASDFLMGEDTDNEDVIYFMIRFRRLALIAAGALLFEMGVAGWFIAQNPSSPVPWIVVVKTLVLLRLSTHVKLSQNDDCPLQTLMDSAPWIVRWERIGAIVTAACFLFFFLVITGLPTW